MATAAVVGETDLVRALALARVRVASVAAPRAPVRYSRDVAEIVPWHDPWAEPDAFVGALAAWAETCSVPPTLFYDGDWDVLAISRNRERLAGLRFAIARAELVEDLVDKARFVALAERLQLTTPPACVLRGEDDSKAAEAVGFPAVVKPLTRQHETWRPLVRGKVAHVESQDDLDRVWEALRARHVDVLVQREVPGSEREIESHHVYVDTEGRIVAEFTGRKLRTFPTEHGYTTALEITDAPDVARAGREVVERTELTGVAKLDFKRGPDGALNLLEVNPRFTLWHHPAALAGVNIPALVHADLSGTPRPAVRPARAGVRWISLRDAQAARAAGASAWRWAAWAAGVEAKSQSPRDPGPLLAALLWRRR